MRLLFFGLACLLITLGILLAWGLGPALTVLGALVLFDLYSGGA
jgi:hypothetical protein